MTMHASKLDQRSTRRFGGWRIAIAALFVLLVLQGLWVFSQRWDRVVQTDPLYPGVAGGIEGNRVDEGAYIYRAAGCASCHKTKGGAELAGGQAFKTPFGTFYSSNIAPDPATGIGGWSEENLIRALREGRNPDGRHYFPAFPYTLMADDDIRALKAYLDTIPPVSSAVADHAMIFPLNLLPIDLVRLGSMAKVVEHGTSYMTPDDLEAIAVYLMT